MADFPLLAGTATAIAIAMALAAAFRIMLQRRERFQNLPPGSLGLPLIGETLQLVFSLRSNRAWEFFHARTAKYGPIFKTHIAGFATVVVPGGSGNHFLFSNDAKLFEIEWPASIGELFGRSSLSLMNGADHRRCRQVFMAFLNPEALQRYLGKTCTLAQNHIQHYWVGQKSVHAYHLMKKFTFSLACNLFLSLADETQQEILGDPFKIWMQGSMQLPIDLPGTGFRKAKSARTEIHRQLDLHINRRRQELENGTVPKDHDLLSVLLTTLDETGHLITDSEIKDNILLLLFAGHDTSCSTLTMIIKFLAQNPCCRNRVVSEQMQIRAEKKGAGLLTGEDIKRMKHTWRVAQESLRLQPPVLGTFRRALKDINLGGYTIPKGWKLYWTPNMSHRREEFFPNPQVFDPSRFEGDGPKPYTFVPFGGGPRTCPGNEFAKMEILTLLHYLATSDLEWSLADPNEGITVDPIPYPKNGLLVNLMAKSHHIVNPPDK